MKGVFKIFSCLNINCKGMACNMVWYIMCTVKSVVYRIPTPGSSLHRKLSLKPNVHQRFATNWHIISNMELACVFSIVAHLGLITYSFLLI